MSRGEYKGADNEGWKCIGHSRSRAADLPRSVEEMKKQDRGGIFCNIM
jgi:hypothetical protein